MDRISNSLIDLFPDLVGNDANSPDSDWRIWGGSRVTAKSFERLMPILRRALFKTLEAVLNRLLEMDGIERTRAAVEKVAKILKKHPATIYRCIDWPALLPN